MFTIIPLAISQELHDVPLFHVLDELCSILRCDSLKMLALRSLPMLCWGEWFCISCAMHEPPAWCMHVPQYGAHMYLSMVHACTPVWCPHVPQYGAHMYLSMVHACTPVWCPHVPQYGAHMYPSIVHTCASAWCTHVPTSTSQVINSIACTS